MHTLPPTKFVALAFALALIGAEARGQEGFRYAQPKAAPKVAKSARVHKDRTEVTILDTWLVKQSSLPGANHRQITAIVEDIILYSSGTMRWKYAIYNKGSGRDNFIFDFPNCYVVDEEGNTIKATGWELTQNYGTMTKVGLPAEAKATFWIEYNAPTRPTRAFKVALVCEGGFSTLPNEFAPFRVTLGDPLSAGGGRPEPQGSNANPPEGEPEPEDAGGLKPEALATAAADRPGGMTSVPARRYEPTPMPSSEAVQAVRAASLEGRRYEGNMEAAAGGRSPYGILFERRSRDRLVSARIYSKGTPAKETKLVGALFESLSSPGGLVFRFENRDEVEYLFSLEGNTLSGRNTAGDRFTFTHKK